MTGVERVALIAAVLVGGVLLVSGGAKLFDRRGTREAVQALGVPLAAPVAVLLAPVEIALAVLLQPPSTGRPAAGAALVLLTAFTVVLVANLLTGRRPQCGCFGGLGSSDVSWRSVGRNGVLLVAAALATGDRAAVSPGDVVLGIALVVGLIAGEQWLSRRALAADDTRQAAELEQGLSRVSLAEHAPAVAPPIAATDLHGAGVTLPGLLERGQPLLLVLLNPGCGPCLRLAPSIVRWHEDYADRLTVAVLTTGTADHVAQSLGPTGTLCVALLPDHDVLEAYGFQGAPGAVLIAPDGRFASPVAAGDTSVRRLLAEGLTGRAAAGQPEAGVDALTSSSRPAARDTVTTRTADGTTALVDEATGSTVEVDVLGGLVWQCLDGVSTLETVVDDLAAVFGADPAVVAVDVLALVRTFGEAGLLAGVAAGPSDPAPIS